MENNKVNKQSNNGSKQDYILNNNNDKNINENYNGNMKNDKEIKEKDKINKQNEKFEQMTKKPVEKLILSLAVPTIMSMMITTIYNTADTYFAGKINSNAIAAIGISYAFMSIIQSFGFLYGHSSGNYMSKVLGKQEIEKGEKMAALGIAFSIGTGILIALITFIFADKISFALGGTEAIQSDIVSYKIIKLLYLGGMPNFARQTIAAVAVLLLNRAAVDYGETAVASFTVVNRITMLLGAAMIGFGQGFQPVCGYNYGAGLYKRVKSALKFSVVISSVFFIVITIICFGTADNIVSLFSDEQSVIELGASVLKYQCISVPLMGWIIMSGMFLQNIGRFKEATIVSAARQGIIFIPLMLLLPNIIGLYGIILVQPLADIGTFLISIPMSIKAIKSMNGAE